MNPQLGSSSFRAAFSLSFLLAATLALPARATILPCSAANMNMPTGRTLLAVDNTLNEVIVLDGSASPVAPACFITVGTSPTNLALSPDPNNPLLLVENDGDATITVVNLADGSVAGTVTLTGVAAPMTANLAVSPDGSFAYVVSLPATVTPGTTQASLTRFALPVPAGASAAPILATLPTAVNGPGLGVAFTPDTTAANFSAYVATEGASYAIPVATQVPSILRDSTTNSPVIAGAAAVDPDGSSAYMVDTATTSSNAAVTVIVGNTVSTLMNVKPICTFADSITVTVPAHSAYYACAGSNFIQAIDTSTNSQMAVGNVSVGSGSAHPQGIAIPYDGVTAYVGLDDGTLAAVDIASSIASPAVTVGTSLRGVAVRFVKISGLSPSTPSVPTGKTQQFTAGLSFANGTTLTWTVNGMPPVSGVSGDPTTVGTINSSGLYTAPAKIPAGGTVNIGVTSPEAPPTSNFYPLTTTVTIAPSQLAFTVQPTDVVAGAAITPAVQVSIEDANGTVVTTATDAVTIAIANNAGGGTLSGTATVNAVGGVATFSDLSIDKTGTGYTLAASSGVLTGATSTAFNVTPGTPTKLAFTVQPTDVVSAASIAPAVQVSIQDAQGNLVPTATNSVTIAIGTNPGGGTLSGTLTANASGGVAMFSNLSIDKTGTGYTLAASAASLTGAISTAFNVTPGTPVQLVFTPQPPASSPLGGNVTPLAAVKVSVEDANSNVVTSSTAPITINSTPANVGGTTTVAAVNGVATFNNLTFMIAGTYSLTATSTPLTSATSTAFALTSNIMDAITSTFTTVLIEDLPAGKDTFAATANNDPNNPSLGVTWKMISCGGSAINLAPCGSVNAQTGAYTPPQTVPLAPANVFVIQATANADTSKTATTGNITITSNITITFTSTFTTVLIEDLPAGKDTFTATANNDPNVPSLGVTWIMTSCLGSLVNTNNPTPCGQVAPNGAYTPPSKVPLAPANVFVVQATSNADTSKTATTGNITITSSIRLTMPASISNVLIVGPPVDFTPQKTGGNVNLGTAASQSDLNLGVTLAITGTCIAPPNYSFSSSNPGCGSFNGSQTASPPTYSYTAPSVVPMAPSCAANPGGCLGTQNKAMITVAAMSVADPNQPSASTTFMISSNISFAIAAGTDARTVKNICNPFFYPSTDTNIINELFNDPCGFGLSNGWPANNNLTPPAPTLAVGFPATLAQANAQGFGTVTGLTWVAPASSGSVQPASGTSTIFTAPSMAPNGGSAIITAYPIADFTRPQTFSMPIVASKLTPHNFLATAPFTPVTPFTLTVASGQSSGSILLDFLGPTSGQINFTAPNSPTNSIPALNPNSTNASVSGTTTVTLTLSVTRGGSTYFRPPQVPGTSLRYLPGGLLALALLFFLTLVLASKNRARFPWAPMSGWRGAVAILVLCAVVLTWAAACNQFSQPGIPPAPIPPTPVTGSAAVTVMGAPTTDASPSTDSLAVPVSVQ